MSPRPSFQPRSIGIGSAVMHRAPEPDANYANENLVDISTTPPFHLRSDSTRLVEIDCKLIAAAPSPLITADARVRLSPGRSALPISRGIFMRRDRSHADEFQRRKTWIIGWLAREKASRRRTGMSDEREPRLPSDTEHRGGDGAEQQKPISREEMDTSERCRAKSVGTTSHCDTHRRRPTSQSCRSCFLLNFTFRHAEPRLHRAKTSATPAQRKSGTAVATETGPSIDSRPIIAGFMGI